jgi:hypothetical protein
MKVAIISSSAAVNGAGAGGGVIQMRNGVRRFSGFPAVSLRAFDSTENSHITY